MKRALFNSLCVTLTGIFWMVGGVGQSGLERTIAFATACILFAFASVLLEFAAWRRM